MKVMAFAKIEITDDNYEEWHKFVKVGKSRMERIRLHLLFKFQDNNKEFLRRIEERLTGRYKIVALARANINSDMRTLKGIAEDYGVTRSTIAQIEEKCARALYRNTIRAGGKKYGEQISKKVNN